MRVPPHKKIHISYYRLIRIVLQNYALHLHQMRRWLTPSHLLHHLPIFFHLPLDIGLNLND